MDATARVRGERQRDGEHARVDRDHGGCPCDRRPQARREVGEREYDDRAVGHRQGGAEGDQQSDRLHATHHRARPVPARWSAPDGGRCGHPRVGRLRYVAAGSRGAILIAIDGTPGAATVAERLAA